MLVDTHCHIHESSYPLDRGVTLARAHAAGVEMMICVGTSVQSSREAVEFAASRDGIYAAIGVHPHETKDGWSELELIAKSLRPDPDDTSKSLGPGLSDNRGGKLVAVGEIGLDYFYTHSPRAVQTEALEAQLQLARDYDVPVIFHVREAFVDFWPIFDNFPGIRGVLHSFTDTPATLETALGKGFYIGVNGISTFARDKQAMFAAIPLDRMLLETDAPFLTPVPFRGKVNEPAFVRQIAEFHAEKRQMKLEELAATTSANARALFAL